MMGISPIEARASSGRDTEKDLVSAQPATEVPEEPKVESDNDSGHVQEGVKLVEAITTVLVPEVLMDYIRPSLARVLRIRVVGVHRHSLVAIHHSHWRRRSTHSGKIIDIRGRMEGFVGSLLLITVGMIMKATCQNIETYAAAQVFTWVGEVAMGFIIDVFVADITTLKIRMIIFAVNSTPNLATTFAGPKIAELFYEK
ncbi:hypothetical protein F5Y06DRAFT_308348 [Hypoxylon sp. FL0890]|nr:hypothetical protein F5Y06DRAFT_308348 [Hypoxylon sp. FL0890]